MRIADVEVSWEPNQGRSDQQKTRRKSGAELGSVTPQQKTYLLTRSAARPGRDQSRCSIAN
jgi:hypothetical protein